MSAALPGKVLRTKADYQAAFIELHEAFMKVSHERDVLHNEVNAMLVAQRPSRKAYVATPEQANAHNKYREALSAARELAITTGKSVTVTSRS